ncbi:prephenate dehydrogenase (NADP(+)) [Podospora pseudocomata]|nr:prephenate dehydrogenase (NADP(+)) [Podospora pseudocomata]KAK4661622.1 prephenate dehydrogenase (NADP(+)) [Podospora pseudopauciseta]KAK4668237.1 prephenate dehydrogenase (NADP(+)) [Podospora pseudoanserina]
MATASEFAWSKDFTIGLIGMGDMGRM